MVDCEYCEDKINELPRKCKYCGHYFCTHHRLPEDHDCQGLKQYSKREQHKLQETIAEIASSHAKVNDRGYEDIVKIGSRKSHHKHKKSIKVKDEPFLYRYIPPEEKQYGLDRIKKETIKTKPKSNTLKSNFKKFLVVSGILFILLFFSLYYFSYQTIIDNQTKNITKTQVITKYQNISDEILFSDYLNERFTPTNEIISLQGFIERKISWSSKDVGFHEFYIVDDVGNQIILLGKSKIIGEIVPSVQKTDNLYQIQGTLKKGYKRLEFRVENISQYKRQADKQVEIKDTESYMEQIVVNRTLPKYPLIRNLVFKLIQKEIFCEDNTELNSCSEEKPFICTLYGLKEDPSKCGCPFGQRNYKEECIFEVKCSDNTLEPECSVNKPKQCINGRLIVNPEICGCPDGFVKRSDTCVKTCSDGTAYGECSKSKPLFCEDSKLINKASKCGCPYSSKDIREGEICLDLSNPDVDIIEKKIHDLINIERKKRGLSELKYDDKIALAARKHSQDMVDMNYFEHYSPEGKDFSDRYSEVGYRCSITVGNYIYGGAENIHQGWTYGSISYTNGIETGKEWLTTDEIAQSAVQGWVNSPGHKENILTSHWKNEGIGVAVSKDGKVLATQNFC